MRRIECQHSLAALPDRVTVKHAVSAANSPAIIGHKRKPDSWRPIVPVWMDKRTLEDVPVFGNCHRPCLPLTSEVGEALIDYLKSARPQSAHREVFLQQPDDEFLLPNRGDLCIPRNADFRQGGAGILVQNPTHRQKPEKRAHIRNDSRDCRRLQPAIPTDLSYWGKIRPTREELGKIQRLNLV